MPAWTDSPQKGTRAAAIVAALACALIALVAVPAFAAAATFEVDSTGDAPDATAGSGTCETASGECTLRAAIEAANDEAGYDEIRFAESVFDGVAGADEIEPATALPPIVHPVAMVGRSLVVGTYRGPSVGVKAPVNAAALTVESPGVTVRGMALNGGMAGIEVLGGSNGFTAKGNWFGLRLDASPAPIDAVGIYLGPGSDGARIGDDEFEPANRNVFGNSEVGVELDGASDTTILGNYFGVDPDGNGPATLANAITINDDSGPPAMPAVHNEIGGVLTTAQAATPACDGACNVIATEGWAGVFISGESAGPGEPTTVRGNFIGLAPDGVTPVGENSYGLFVIANSSCGAGPGDVTVGGSPATEGNYIVGGQIGIYAEGAENFTAAGNSIGVAADGSKSASPEAVGIAVCAEGVTRAGHVADNRMKLSPDALGIESSHGRAEITGNTIDGGFNGILLNEESEGHGDLVQGNSIVNAEREGIAIENDSNVVIGNSITRAGWIGIVLASHSDHNRIGGDGPGEANAIVEAGGSEPNPDYGAITMFGREGDVNEFAANTGFGNAGAFIKVFQNNEHESPPNRGIKPPPLGMVRQSSAAGTAEPYATVRIFSKASAEEGELGGLLAVVKADGVGAWSATYATQSVGTLIAATQTTEAGTPEAASSMVGAPTAASADPSSPEENKGGKDPGGSQSSPSTAQPPPPAKAPKVKITKGPKKSATSTTVKFRFKAKPAVGAKFQCKLGSAKWATCKSPKIYRKLKPGKHTFRVRAKAGGRTGPVTKYRFTVKG